MDKCRCDNNATGLPDPNCKLCGGIGIVDGTVMAELREEIAQMARMLAEPSDTQIELAELRAVVGPKLTCCDEWAIRHSDTTSDEEGGRVLRWCPRRGYWLEAEPDFIAWQSAGGVGRDDLY